VWICPPPTITLVPAIADAATGGRGQSATPNNTEAVAAREHLAAQQLTMDSEEGALVSAMAVAHYAFDIDPLGFVLGGVWPLNSKAITARGFYLAMYNMMFPGLRFNIADLARSLLGL
jgi:hypothetical protein